MRPSAWTLAALLTLGMVRPGPAQEPFVLRGHTNGVLTVAFSPDSRTLASGAKDQTVRLWDVATRRERLRLDRNPLTPGGHEHEVTLVAFLDGKTLITAGHDTLGRLWDLPAGTPRRVLNRTYPIIAPRSVSANGRFVAASLMEKQADANGVFTVKVGEFCVWDVASNREKVLIRAHDKYCGVALSPDGSLAATSDGSVVRIWEVATAARVTELPGGGGPMFSHDGKTLAVGGRPAVTLWDTATWRRRARLGQDTENPNLPNGVSALAFSADDRRIAVGNQDGTVAIWNLLKNLKEATRAASDLVWCVAWSPDGRWLACGCFDGTVKLWDLSLQANGQMPRK